MPQRLRLRALRALPAAFLAFASLLFQPVALAAPTLDGPDAAIGEWDISIGPGVRTCRLMLRGEKVHGGYFVGMPPGCRRALPVLSNVSCWVLQEGRHLDLADVYGKPVLDFAAGEGGRFAATGPQGEAYRLTFVEGSAPPRPAAAAPPPQTVAAGPAASPPPVRPGDVAGRYAVLRDAGRDTGCMVTLDEQPGGQGGNKAFLAPACRDQGIVIFDPAGWRIVKGRLVLTARKGHTAELDLQPDGTWLKDAKDGKSLVLKKF